MSHQKRYLAMISKQPKYNSIKKFFLHCSVSAGILLVTSFCFGATLLSIALDLSKDNQLPNLLSFWNSTSPQPKPHNGFQCGQGKKANCFAHLENEPYSGLMVEVEIDTALADFFEKLLNEYVYEWYREISYDEDFVQEIRHVLRHAVAILVKRLCRVDLTDLIVKKVIPIALCHLDALMHADNFVKSSKNTRQINLEIREAYLDYIGQKIHPAALSRIKEVDYNQSICNEIVPFLLPPRYKSSKTMGDLIKDLVFGAVLQPVMDLIGNPDTANVLIDLAFNGEPSKQFPPASGQKKELLDQFVKTHQSNQNSALRVDMSTILKNEAFLFAFMKFLKEKQAIDQLHFCLAVEEFNKKIMNEISEEDMKSLHEDATNLFNLHFKADADHKVSVSPHLVDEIKQTLDGPMSDVVQLRSTPPLFKAYEEIYSSMESKYCPSFFKSEEYFTYLLGKRQSDIYDGTDKNSSKLFWKSWFTQIRKLPMTFVKDHSPFNTSKRQELRQTATTTSIFYDDVMEQQDVEALHNVQNLTLTVPESSNLEKSKCPSDIDIARSSALASLHRSSSLTSLNNIIGDQATTTTSSCSSSEDSGVVQTSNSMTHNRSKSAGGTIDWPLLVESSNPYQLKSNTFPKSTPPVLLKKACTLKKKTMKRTNVKHFMGTGLISRTKDLNSKAGEKLGKGLSKLKQGVLGRSMEGIIDGPMDPAFDIADMCNDEEFSTDDPDETITASICSTNNKGGLDNISVYRDLSAWRIQIPKVATSSDKKSFVFVIDVHRIDIDSTGENTEETEWTVYRKNSEFYTLESKLTEFHGAFEDLHLPPKANLFTGKGLDVLQSKIKPFEEYLIGLLKKPFLRESDILYTFLRSPEEFTLTSSFGVGKIINKVNPIKLTKERGQFLQPFIDNFVASTKVEPSKPRYDSVIGSYDEHDDQSARVIEPHKLFGNNFDLHAFPRHGRVFSTVEKYKLRQDQSVFDVIFYLAATLFKTSSFILHLLYGVGILFRKSFDFLVDYAIRNKLSTVLCCNRIAYLIRLVESSLFDTSASEPEDKARRKELAMEHFMKFLRPLIQPLTGRNNYEDGIHFVFEALQDPVLNKQLSWVLIDTALTELFPEISVSKMRA